MLSFLGFDISCLTSKPPGVDLNKSSIWLKLSRVALKVYYYCHVLLIALGGFVSTAYVTFATNSLISKTMVFAFTVFFGCILFMIIWMHKHSTKISRSLSKIIRRFDQKDINYLRSHDKYGVIGRLLLMGIPALVSIILFFTLNHSMDSHSFDAFYVHYSQLFFEFFAFTCAFFYLIWTGHFYWMVATIAKIYASHCKRVIEEIRNRRRTRVLKTVKDGKVYELTDDFELIQKTLGRYFAFVREINETLGAIPLTMFVALFLDIILAVSLVTLFENWSFGFAAVSLGCSVLNQLIGVFQVIHAPTVATGIVEEAIILADKLAATPLPEKATFNLLESRRSLTVFLQKQTSVPFSAQSTFVLEPSVVLSFFNAVVPFTVMFITTIAHINKDRSNSFLNTLTSNCTM